LHFESAAVLVTTPATLDLSSQSVTIGMFAQQRAGGSGPAFEIQTAAGVTQASMGFSAGGDIEVGVGGATATFAVGLTADTWTYATASIYKTGTATSRVCLSY